MNTLTRGKVTALVVAAQTLVRTVEQGDSLGGIGDWNIVGLLFIVGRGERHVSSRCLSQVVISVWQKPVSSSGGNPPFS